MRERMDWKKLAWKRIPPPGWLAIALIAVLLIYRLIPAGNVIPDMLRAFGYFQVALGLLLAVDVAVRFVRARTPVHPFHTAKVLVTDGMLRFSRNPIYLGMALIVFGFALILGTLPGLLVVPGLVWVLTVQIIRGEEEMLEAEFGEDYRAYKARVRRWL